MRGMMRKASAVLAVLAVTACAANDPGDRSSADGETPVRVVVENGGTIPTQVRVFLMPASGPEFILGSMSTLGTETLTVRGNVNPGQYRLRAEGGTSSVLTSPVFSLGRGDVIAWDMRRNVVQRRQ
jgi:hypothetical protein